MNESPQGIPKSRQAAIWLGAIGGLFLLLRLPVMYHQPGGQDEEFYAVPGLTILETGLPQLPHVPARNLESAFYRSDEVLFSEPPLYFYYQALFYAVLPDVYGTARLASGVAGLLSLWLVYRLSLAGGATMAAGLWAAGLFSFSRWFYFPATSARPDCLCGLFGFLAILCVWRWRITGRLQGLFLAGVCIGLGGLTHPFAVVYAVQLAAWVFLASRGWRRIGHPALLAGVSLLVFSTWLPLIAANLEIFRIQFRNQFGGHADGSVWLRALLPGPSLIYHGRMLWDHIGPIQMLLPAAGLIGATLAGWRDRSSGIWTISCLAWSSLYLMSISVGPHHPVFGYWIYSAGLMFVCVGHSLSKLSDAVLPARRRLVIAGITLGMILLLVPGSGLRTLAAHVRHWNDINYDSPRFARRLIDSLPADAVYAVDTQFALDFLAAGRKTLLANNLPVYFRIDQFEFDYLIVSRRGQDIRIAQQLETEFLRAEGIPDDKFACYAEIHIPSGREPPADPFLTHFRGLGVIPQLSRLGRSPLD